jgi:hypothetical protein
MHSTTLSAQHSEIGAWLGSATYFGDLNPDYNLSQTRPAFGLLYRYTVGDYVVLKAGLAAARLQHRDDLSKNPFQQARNLSFRTNIYELSGQIDLHFKKYIIGSEKYYFTPYMTAGIALFKFNPQTKYDGEWYNLNPLGTEGQWQPDFSGRTRYPLIQLAAPLGLGIKYWMRNKWNFYVEAAYRHTLTDYIDDVSSVYVSNDLLTDGSLAAELADRSDEVVEVPIGEVGKQRGDITANDGYLMLNMGLTYTIFNRKCPRPGR